MTAGSALINLKIDVLQKQLVNFPKIINRSCIEHTYDMIRSHCCVSIHE